MLCVFEFFEHYREDHTQRREKRKKRVVCALAKNVVVVVVVDMCKNENEKRHTHHDTRLYRQKFSDLCVCDSVSRVSFNKKFNDLKFV